MEWSYSIDSNEHLVSMKVSGEVTADALIDLMGQAGDDPAFAPGMSAIADYRDAYGEWDYSEIQKLRDHVAQIVVPHEVRWAAVVKPGALAAIGHILVLISEAVETKIKIKLFADFETAQGWVRGDTE